MLGDLVVLDSPPAAYSSAVRKDRSSGQRGARYGAFHIFAVDDLRVFAVQNSRMTLQETADLGHGAAVPAFAMPMSE